MSIKALERHLMPLMPFMRMDGVTEICVNRPQEVYVERNGQFIRYEVEELEYGFLNSLACLVAEFNNKEFPTPLLSGSLPFGERIQFVMNPACENEKLVLSIRSHQMRDISLDDYSTGGVFDGLFAPNSAFDDLDIQLKELYHKKDILNFIKLAIQGRKNILISGGTGTGKTTFLNACLKWIPQQERIITVEDTREVVVGQPNAVHLLFNEEDKQITASQVFKICLRLRPDRILLSELRGSEVWSYLRAANSGHPGSLSTVHADNPEGAFTQLGFMMQQAGSTSSEEQIRAYIKSIIHVVIQLKRCATKDRFMTVADIYFNEIDNKKII